MPAKPLSPEQLEDAKRLSSIFLSAQKLTPELTQESLAHACGWKTQGTVNQYLNGKIPLNLQALLKFAKVLMVRPAEISPVLARQLQNAEAVPDSAKLTGAARNKSMLFDTHQVASTYEGERRQVVKDMFGLADSSYIVITNASASMGAGLPRADHEQVVNFIQVAKSWVNGNLPAITAADQLAILTAYGDSMTPTFSDGDLLLVDRGVNEIHLDAVYVISRNNELFIKRVRRRMQDGAVIIKSDNPLYGPDDIIENGEREHLEILGRVVWAWSGKKL